VDFGFETLQYEERGRVAIVTLDRPDVHNVFDSRMQSELRTLWRALREHDDVRAVVLTGAGEKAFCAGVDRMEVIEDAYLQGEVSGTGEVGGPFHYNDPGDNVGPKACDLWKPVVAAINGMACGGALYLLGEADIILAAEHATFFDPHVTFGMVAGFESVHLMQKLPLGETLRVALLGAHERMSAERAHQLGLVSEITTAEDLLDRAMWVADAIASAPALATQGTLRAIWMANEMARREALAQMSNLVLLGTTFENIEEGQAYFQSERPKWQLR
jgi:enoyl-CoA hydratase/carnithine racemase